MGCARYIGRVGALAVTLGVGVAVATMSGVAEATPTTASTGDTTAVSASPSTTSSDGDDPASDGGGAQPTDEADGPADDEQDGGDPADDLADDLADEADDPYSEEDGLDADVEAVPDLVDETPEDSAGGDYLQPPPVPVEPDAGSAGEPDNEIDDYIDDYAVTDETADAPVVEESAVAPDPEPPARTAVAPQVEPETVMNTLAAPSAGSVQSDPAPVPGAPLQATLMVAALAAVRDELERNLLPSTTVAPQQLQGFLVDPSPNVLVIGVDGTNLSRVLDDYSNANFFALMQDGTTAPASIAGHTTISNPSWTAILTGVWAETTGVINNVFTPWTYDTWPTVFNRLETLNPAIQTTAIADWDVIAAIAGAGSVPADTIIYQQQIDGDTNWLLTDDAIGDATESAIAAADPDVPNFIFSYFVGVDENGHLYGGASPEYAEAINNVDRNLGEILQVVDEWEALTGEQWTVIVVTDHGHQPQKGFGHGFQSPDETATFVIAENPLLFSAGVINLQYQIIDVTPTVVTLFGGVPADYSDGVSLTTLGDSDVVPVDDDEALRAGLQDIIDKYGYPDIGTELALGARTIFATLPYWVFGFTNGIVDDLQSVADEDIPVVSQLAVLAIVPVKIIGGLVYAATNTIAQIVAWLTGVQGASIFPLWPPEPPSFETPEPDTLLDAAVCDGGLESAGQSSCEELDIAV